MNKTIKAALITASATIIASVISLNIGKSIEQKNIQSQINNIIGNDNNITINDISNMIENYQNLQERNESLEAQNIKYFEDLTTVNNEIEELKMQTDNTPEFIFNNLALSIDGKDISINKNNSMVTINGMNYYSEEIFKNILPENKNMTVKDDTLFIGNVIADKSNLGGQKVVDYNLRCELYKSIEDSYGNTYANVTKLDNQASLIYNLERKYTMMDISIAMAANASLNQKGILTIKADDEIVYTSPKLTKTTEPFTVTNIPIDNCSLLTIEYNGNWYNWCIISDAIVYN